MGTFTKEGFVFRKRMYDSFKWVALVLLPSAGSFYFGLGQIPGLHIPAVTQVVGVLAATDLFVGLLIRRTAANYQASKPPMTVEGKMVMEQYPNGEVKTPRIEVEKELPIFTEGHLVAFKVERRQVPEMDPAQE